MRINGKFINLKVFVFCFVLVTFCLTSSVYSSQRWWQREDEGWFFYKDPVKMEVEEAQDPKLEVQELEKEEAPLASEVMRKEAERLLGEAVTEPTETNIRRYLEYQKKMLQLADRFAAVWQRVLMKYPELYAQVDTGEVDKDIQRAISELKEEAGLFFIYSSNCPACQRGASVIRSFREKHGFTVVPVSIDGGVLPELPDTRHDNGLFIRLGLQSVPAVFLAYPYEDRFEHIGTGFMTLPDLERRLYHYVITENYSGNYFVPFGL